MKSCLLCGELTSGSIGAAGLVWDNCCQTCKDSEDAALALQTKALAKGFRFILSSLGIGEQNPQPIDSIESEETGYVMRADGWTHHGGDIWHKWGIGYCKTNELPKLKNELGSEMDVPQPPVDSRREQETLGSVEKLEQFKQ